MLLTNQHPHNKSITISVLGRPNAGKSTFINTLIGFDLSIVTPKAQTTRNKYACRFTIDKTEVILMDTPGIHKSGQELNKRMNEQVREAVDGVDCNFLLIDSKYDIIEEIKSFNDDLKYGLNNTILVITKIDQLKLHELEALLKSREEILTKGKLLIPSIQEIFFISSKEETNIHNITGKICDMAQFGPHHFYADSFSDKKERFFVAEYIREQLYLLLNEELPYETAVVIDDYKDNFDENKERVSSKITASILVNRPSQRAIVVGKQGSLIKEIGNLSRAKIEELLGNKVFLNLHVKVSPKWFKNNFVLTELGLPRAQDSARVWRNL